MSEEQDLKFGEIAISEKLLSLSQVEECRRTAADATLAGLPTSLSEAVVKKGYIQKSQADAILRQLVAAEAGKNAPIRIGNYEILAKIGEGGMGAVYKAKQLGMERLVALKILPPRLAKDKLFIDRFYREARSVGKLNHVNIVTAHEVGEADGYHYLAMEFVDGETLLSLLKRQGVIPEERALEISMQITSALSFAWQEVKLVHRDVKPDNILLTGKGVAKLADLGLAKEADAQATAMTQSGMALGTPHYISPEQVRGDKDVDTRSDIYSLGATLYHAVTGRTPFEGTSAGVVMAKHLTEQPPDPKVINPLLSDNICHVIGKMMAKDREDRYQTPAELADDIEFVMNGEMPISKMIESEESPLAKTLQFETVPPEAAQPAHQGTELAGEKDAAADAAGKQVAKSRITRWATGAIAAAAVSVLVLVGYLAMREEGTDPLKENFDGEKMYKYIEKWIAENPQDFDVAIAKYQLLRSRSAGTVWEMKAQDALAQVRHRWEKAAQTEFGKLKERAGRLAASGDYDGAIVVYRRLPEKFAKILSTPAENSVAKLREQAQERISAALAAAEKLSKEGEADRALAELEKVAGLRYAALSEKVNAVRTRLEEEKKDVEEMARKKVEAAANRKVAEYWERFDEKIFAGGDWAAAKEVLADAQDDEVISRAGKESESAKTLENLAGLVAAFERTRLIPEKEPETRAGFLADAVTAMAHVAAQNKKLWKAGKTKPTVTLLEEAESALAKAEGHALWGHYSEKLKLGKEEEVKKLRVYARKPLEPMKWPFDTREAKLRQNKTERRLGRFAEKVVDLGGGVTLDLVLIPVGEFMMGGKYPPEEIDRRGGSRGINSYNREHPRHRVHITKPYYMGKYEVTQEVWQKVMGANPAYFKDKRNPVERVSWHDCQEFVKKLSDLASKKEKLTFRFPTEAEWEHACRAGTETPFNFGETIKPDIANYNGQRPWDGKMGVRRGTTTEVGSFKPNPWGLYDMVGNVWEWVEDWYGAYPKGVKDTRIDPRGPESGSRRVLRGGSWSRSPSYCRSAYRDRSMPENRGSSGFGFRVAMSVAGMD